MAYLAETGLGTRVEYEIHRSPMGVAGVVAHWGDKVSGIEIKDGIRAAYPDAKLDDNTGFKHLWHHPKGITRSHEITDELELAEFLTRTTIEENGWDIDEVDGLVVGSGVPIADDPKYADYAKTVADILGLRPDVYLHNTYAACASGGHEFIEVASNPDLKDKKIVLLAMEAIGHLVEDPKAADEKALGFFGNGAAAIGMEPGKNVTILTKGHNVVRDDEGTLKALATYQSLRDPDGDTWQEHGNTSTIYIPPPEVGMRISLAGPKTGAFFARCFGRAFPELPRFES